MVKKKAAPCLLGCRFRGYLGVLNLNTEYGLQEGPGKHHEYGGKEPAQHRFVDTGVAHLPVLVNAQAAYDTEYARDHEGAIQCGKK